MTLSRLVTTMLLIFTALSPGCVSESGSAGFSPSSGWTLGDSASLGPWLNRNLQALKQSRDEHLLTDAEYVTFRQAAIERVLKAPAPPRPEAAYPDVNAGVWLRDELHVANAMIADKLISQEEFQKFKSHVMEIYRR